MNNWNEIKYSLGFNIVFPRFCLFVGMPCGLLIVVPSPPAFPLLLAVLQPHYAEIVVTLSLVLFSLSIAANLSVSRYLRLHQTLNSPYAYKAEWDLIKHSNYFRIQIPDKEAFCSLLRGLRRDHPREAIRFWLLIDDIVFIPPVILLSLFAVIFMLLPSLVMFLFGLLKRRKPYSTSFP